MSLDGLRARGDRDLAERLLAKQEVKRAIERFEKETKDAGARRQLLATSIRITEAMAPELHRVMERCRERLEIEMPLETFVYPDANFNAAAVRPERGRFFVLFTSSLLEAFEADELAFVVGHELGHHLFEHHKIPVAGLLTQQTKFDAGTVLQLFAWQRYAEISCDRAGLHSAGGIETATRALFKVASGLSSSRVKIVAEQFLAQLGDLREEVARLSHADEPPRLDWFSTHPFSPMRLQAAQLFARSAVMVEGGMSLEALEGEVEELMNLMSPSYLKERSEAAEAMRRLLYAGGAALAQTVEGEARREALDALEQLLGIGSVPLRLDVAEVLEDLPRRIARVTDVVPPLRRAQVLRDLCVIARADGKITEAELAILREIADKIDVDFEQVASSIEDAPAHGDKDEAPPSPPPSAKPKRPRRRSKTSPRKASG